MVEARPRLSSSPRPSSPSTAPTATPAALTTSALWDVLLSTLRKE